MAQYSVAFLETIARQHAHLVGYDAGATDRGVVCSRLTR
jgi:hypothetical protein